MTIPKAAKHPHTMTLHGETRTDNYYWLRDDERSCPEVLDYLRQENDYCQQQLSAVKDLEKGYTRKWWPVSRRKIIRSLI